MVTESNSDEIIINDCCNTWNNCKFKDNDCCGFIKFDTCNKTCDLINVMYNKDDIIKKGIEELNFIIKNWKKEQNSLKIKNSIYGFLLLSGILFEKFEYNIKQNLSLKQKIFILRNNLFKKL